MSNTKNQAAETVTAVEIRYEPSMLRDIGTERGQWLVQLRWSHCDTRTGYRLFDGLEAATACARDKMARSGLGADTIQIGSRSAYF